MALALLCGTFDMSFEPSLLTGAKTNTWAEKSYVLLENSSSLPFPRLTRLNRDCSWHTCRFCNCWNVKRARLWSEIITYTNSKALTFFWSRLQKIFLIQRQNNIFSLNYLSLCLTQMRFSVAISNSLYSSKLPTMDILKFRCIRISRWVGLVVTSEGLSLACFFFAVAGLESNLHDPLCPKPTAQLPDGKNFLSCLCS